MQDYRRLRVWKKAFALAINVRRATTHFPRTGYGELKAQIVSAAESIVFNIVEGCGAGSQREFARFLEIAIKSTMELEAELQLAHAYGAMRGADWHSLSPETADTRRMLYGLRKKVLHTDPSGSIGHGKSDNAKRDTHTARPAKIQRPSSDATPTGRPDA